MNRKEWWHCIHFACGHPCKLTQKSSHFTGLNTTLCSGFNTENSAIAAVAAILSSVSSEDEAKKIR